MYGVSAGDDEKVLGWQWRLYQHSDYTQQRWIVWLKYGVLYVCAMYVHIAEIISAVWQGYWFRVATPNCVFHPEWESWFFLSDKHMKSQYLD